MVLGLAIISLGGGNNIYNIVGKAAAYTENQCTLFTNSQLKVIGEHPGGTSSLLYGSCDWLVGKILTNGSGFHISGFGLGQDDNEDPFNEYVLTK